MFRQRFAKIFRGLSLAMSPSFVHWQWLISYYKCIGADTSYCNKRPVNADGGPRPWMVYSAVEFLDQLDLSSAYVFEWGSGNSSLYFAESVRGIVSIERNRDWHEHISQISKNNHTVFLIEDRDGYIDALNNCSFMPDIVVIDGSWRLDCAKRTIDMHPQPSLILLDNSDWHPNTCALIRQKGYVQVDFCGPGPINNYAWATSMFLGKNFLSSFHRKAKQPMVRGGLVQFAADDAVN